MPNIIKRLDRLKALVPTPLIVICKLPTGEEANLTVDECIAAEADPMWTQGNNIKFDNPNCLKIEPVQIL